MQRALLVLVVLIAIVLLGGYLGSRHSVAPVPTSSHQDPSATTEGLQDVPDTRISNQQGHRSSGQGSSGPAATDPIAGLTNIDASMGRLTPEQAAKLKQGFQALIAQGSAAVPSIRAVLDQKVEINFGKGSGDSIGAPSLRTGLLETLRQIGGPEAIEASRQVLQTTSDPLEIALLTRNLEESAPGQYRQDSLDATTAALNAAAQGQMTNNDVGPLFQALQSFGDTNAIGQLLGLAPKYGYYTSLALAGLPSGAGIPALSQMAQDTSEAGTGNRQFALQMLAQASSRNSDAGTALVDLTRQNQIPDTAWGAIAAVLGGQQFQFTRQYPNNMFATLDGPDLRTYRQQNGNQNFISTTPPSDASAQDLNQRLALIDQLMATTSNPAALQALQQARAKLAGSGTR